MKKITKYEYIAPWEKAFERVLTPLEDFIHRQTTSGILLMLCAIMAIYIANSQWSDVYHHVLTIPFTIGIPGFQLSKTLHHWINDGLMAIFFFVIGLELKREILVGELANIKLAMLPIIAAFGGMVMPVLIYLSFNPEGDTISGWGHSYGNRYRLRHRRSGTTRQPCSKKFTDIFDSAGDRRWPGCCHGDCTVLYRDNKHFCSRYCSHCYACSNRYKSWRCSPLSSLHFARHNSMEPC